jgi:nitrous oxidase accessory protein NosD
MQAVVAAPGAVVGGLVVVNGVRPAMAAAGAAVGAGAAAAGMRRRSAAPGAAGLLLALAAGVILGALPGLLTLRLRWR